MQETTQALTQITIDLDTFLSIALGVIVLVINGPIAFILWRVIRDLKAISDEHAAILSKIYDAEKALNVKHESFRGEVYREFVRKEDINPRLQHIESILEKIFNRLDSKADK